MDTIIIRQYIEVSTCTIFKTFFYKSNVILCIIYPLLWNACTSLYNLLELFTPKCIFHASLLFHNAYSVIYGVIVIQIVRQYIFLLQALSISFFNHLLNIATIYIFLIHYQKQKFMYGRNVFQSISDIVDELFQNYLSRPSVRQPILTQYCDGQRVTCTNWLSQWGSKYLGDQNYSAIEILRYYYGNNMFINTAEEVSGIPASWPRVDLTIGSTGDKVRQIQEQLARISQSYPAIPTVTPDGIFGSATRAAVEKFQSVFGLPVTGVIDYQTWYKISEIYVAVTRIAELS